MVPATGRYKTARPVTVCSKTRKICTWTVHTHTNEHWEEEALLQ